MTTLETQLLDFGLTLAHPVNFKEVDTGRYLFSNPPSAHQVGIATPERMLGLTVHDLSFSRTQTNWGRALAANIERMDHQAQVDKVHVNDNALYLKPDGSLIFQSVTKIPILSRQGRVIAIATINQDMTYRMTQRLLFEQYTLLCGKKQAPRRMLRHLRLETWFCAAPTHTEMKVLLERAAGKANKVIAAHHKVSTRTVETHLLNLRSKLRGDVLHHLLEGMRRPEHLIDAI